jgi:hypothetical protein
MNDTATIAHSTLSPEQHHDLQQNASSVLDTFAFWLKHFSPKFYSTAFLMAFLKLFAEPGMKKNELMLFLENNAKVSRSTAERMIGDAHREGHIVMDHQGTGNALAISLSDALAHHCAVYLALRSKRAAETSLDYEECLACM